jgi:N-acetylmuramoyl-L-alanine amidase
MKLLVAVAISASILGGQPRTQLHSVTAVRHYALADATRIAIEVSGEFQFRTDRLHNPERVYFDILDARPRLDPRLDSRKVFRESFDDRLVTGMRVAETAPGVTRIVLDIASGVEVSTSQLANPDRLIVELRTGAAPAIPTAAAAPPVAATPAPRPAATDVPAQSAPRQPDAPAPVPSDAAPKTESTSRTEGSAKPDIAAKPVKPDNPANLDASAKPESGAGGLACQSTPPGPGCPAKPSGSRDAKTDVAAETSKAARHTSSGNTSLVRALGLKIGRVVIDAGHGGHDQGTSGPRGLLEKDVVLDIALRVGKLIEDRLGAEVIYTRSDDTFVPLEGRTALANDKKADLFFSIHANSSSTPHIAGVETYYLNLPDSRDKDAADVAARENASSQKSVFELQDLVKKITLNDKVEESREFAARVQASLYAFSARNIPNSRNRGVKKAPFVVLIGAHMPSILAEIGFLSNPREETLLRKPEYRQKLAEALFRGVQRYAEGLSHFQVAKASNEE